MTSKPILYLDCDGVVSPWFWNDGEESEWKGWKLVREAGDSFSSWFSEQLFDALLDTGLDIRWLSMRGEGCNRLIQMFGYDPLPVACDPARLACTVGHHMTGIGGHEETWFKAEHVNAVAFHPTHPPTVWIDDEIAVQRDKPRVDKIIRRLEELPFASLSPQTRVGLTTAHVAMLKRFGAEFN